LTSIIEKQTDPRVIPIPSRAVSHGTRGEALASHCPTKAQTNLPRTSSDRKRLKSPRRLRRNTLPSLILTEQEAQILAGPKDDLAMQSWRQVEAVSNKFKRRSRSADDLHDMAASYNLKDIPPEDRTAQIAYWRTSVLDNPTPSYRWPVKDEDRPDTSRPPELAPIQTFDFGLEKPDSQPATLEERVNTLEVKMFDFEYAIARLQGHDIPKPLLHPKAPPKRRSIHELFPSDTERTSLSSPPLHEPISFLASPEESPMPSGEEERFRPDRSSKATTIRPLTARRRSPLYSSDRDRSRSSSSHLTTSQFDQIMDLLKQEHSMRQKLEEQVAALQKEVALLRTPVYAEIRQAYSTPSPESVHETPVQPRHLHRSPRFYSQEKTPTPQHQAKEQQRAEVRGNVEEKSRFSMSDSIDTGMETEEEGTETDGEEGSFQDVYETPQENWFVFESVRGSPLVGVN
jgi:hypothetical protein